jgi:hypothetical protein
MLPELGAGKGTRRRPPGLLGRIIAGVVTVAVMVLGLMFSLAVFAVGLALGVIVFGWLWWKLRRALKQAQQDPRFRAYHDSATEATQPGSNQVIEGEVIRGEWQDQDKPR